MIDYMEKAYSLAKKAYKKGEVPIGAVVVKDGKIISTGYNKREKSQNAIDHAEIIAIRRACKRLHSWRLDDCDIYVTLKPCPMCAGAISNARIRYCYYGADNQNDNNDIIEKIMTETKLFNHKTKLVYTQKSYCSEILTQFFKQKR